MEPTSSSLCPPVDSVAVTRSACLPCRWSPRRCPGALGVAAAVVALAAWQTPAEAQQPPVFRPPAVPLVTHDPMLSIWSEADRLTDDATRHWTHHEQSLVSLIRIDGKPFRLMGNTPAGVPALPQVGLTVTPTRSIYEFEGRTSTSP